MKTEREMIILQEENKLKELKRQLSDKFEDISSLEKRISEQRKLIEEIEKDK